MSKAKHEHFVVEGNTGYFCKICGERVGSICMSNDEDEWIDEALATLQSELTDLGTRYFKREIPDIMTLTDLRKLVTDKAKTTIKAKLLEARLDEFLTDNVGVGYTDEEVKLCLDSGLWRESTVKRYQELQASAPTKKGE